MLIEDGKLPRTVFAQIGHSEYIPRHYSYERFLPHSRLIEAIQASDLVITHDGAGSIREALILGKRTIVVPRKSRAGELMFNSDAELATHLSARGWIDLADDPSDIPETLANARVSNPSYGTEEGRDVNEVLFEFLREVEQKG
jgi:UDP-N-acetylglucosamine transferase subunit ALG13